MSVKVGITEYIRILNCLLVHWILIYFCSISYCMPSPFCCTNAVHCLHHRSVKDFCLQVPELLLKQVTHLHLICLLHWFILVYKVDSTMDLLNFLKSILEFCLCLSKDLITLSFKRVMEVSDHYHLIGKYRRYLILQTEQCW